MSEIYYELTNPQNSIWLTEQFYKSTAINSVCGSVTINEIVDFDILEKAINLVIEHNNSFNLNFKLNNKKLLQFITSYSYKKIKLANITKNFTLEKLQNSIINEPLSILDNNLYKFTMFKFQNGTGGVILNIHHIISDSWTLGMVSKQIIEYYSCLLNNTPLDFSNNYSYIDYIDKENLYKTSLQFFKDKQFWEETFQSIPENIVSFPYEKKCSAKNNCKANRLTFNIDNNAIYSFCKDNNISAYCFFMAIFSIYLGRCNNTSNVTIGSPILNRLNFKDKNTTGMFVNVIPFKVDLENIQFNNFIKNISSQTLSFMKHQKYSYQTVLEDLRKKDSSISSLYNVLLSYQITKTTTDLLNSHTDWVFNGNTSNDVDIHIYDINDSGKYSISFDYNTDLYSEDYINNIIGRIENIIFQVIKNPSIFLNNIEIVTPDEKDLILYKFNKTAFDYDSSKTIIQIFEEQVKMHPNDTAIVFEGKEISYKTLNKMANKLAWNLRENGLKPNNIVAIILDRSIELLVAIIAVLKAGGAYIAIDPNFPTDRINYMLDNSTASIILTDNTFENISNKINIINITSVFETCNNTPCENLSIINTQDDLSYIIYTSGSTGNPKGVMLTHKNLMNFYFSAVKEFKFLNSTNKYSFVSITTMSFDIFVFETIISLVNGQKVFMTNRSQQINTLMLEELIHSNKIDIIQSTPSVMNFHLNSATNLNNFSSLKYIILAGEPLPIDLIHKIKSFSPDCTVYNGYGPSETTIFSTITDVTNDDFITIGQPIGNTQIYILDQNMQVLPPYSIGELYISGDGVGKGYLNNLPLTKEKFIRNPFVQNSIMYRTGDLGLFTSNGIIECKGRSDSQIKINGIRIEIGEIEEALNSFSDSIKSAIILKVINGKKYLTAFVSSPSQINLVEVKQYLLTKLPTYMIPNKFVYLEELPYTPNGKIDKKSLSNIDISSVDSNIIQPKSETEKKLYNIFKSKINNDFSIDSDFYSIGLNSLDVINLSLEIYDIFNIDLPTNKIYELQNILNLAKYLDNYSDSNTSITKAELKEFYPLSSAQKRIYFSCINNNSLIYNISGNIVFNEILDFNKIKQAFSKIVNSNIAFRTNFKLIDGIPYQFINTDGKFDISYEILNNAEELSKVKKEFSKPFDLENSVLLRIKVCSFENKTIILLDSHHIILDGTSLNILLKEFSDIYHNSENITKPFDYIDYSEWENKFLTTPSYFEIEKYWLKSLDNAHFDRLPLFYKKEIPNKISSKGKTIVKIGSADLFEQISSKAKKENVSPYIFCLSAFYLLLYKYSKAETIIVGSPTSSRYFKEFNNVIGMFVNNLILKQNIDLSKNLHSFIHMVKNTVLDALKNQPCPYNNICNKLHLKPNESIFYTMFIFQDIYDKGFNVNYLETNTSKFDFSLEVIPSSSTLKVEYKTDLFENETMEIFLENYLDILNVLLCNTSEIISNICTYNNTANFEKSDSSAKKAATDSNTCEILVNILKNIFNNNSITMQDNFFELGGDSLLALKFQIEAMKYNININYSDILEYQSIENLCSNINCSNNEDNTNIEDYSNINLLLSKNDISNIPSTIDFSVENIILTGATGYLGAHILDAYFNENKNGLIFCLVREKANINSIDRLRNTLRSYFGNKYDSYFNKNIFVINGDITLENLGISHAECLKLCKQATCLINSAALVKHFGNFNEFNSINVIGTQNVIDFCKNYKIKLYHISTLSISGDTTSNDSIEKVNFSEKNLFIEQSLDNVYIYTKFLSEKLILNEVQNGLSACIFRIGNICNRYSDGIFQINYSENAFINRIKSIIELGYIDENLLSHSVEITPVDLCATAIVKVVLSNPNFTVFHISNNSLVKILTIYETLLELGYNIEKLASKEFSSALLQFVKNSESNEYITGFLTQLNKNNSFDLFLPVTLDNTFSEAYLKLLNFSWFKIDTIYLKKLIKYFKNIGYF